MDNQVRFTHIGCYGCRYNMGYYCSKGEDCIGREPYPMELSLTSNQNKIIQPTPFPEEIEINGIKYRRVNEDER